MFQRFKFQVCLLVQKGPKFHNIGTNNVNCTYSRVRPSINIKDKVWQTVFVSDISFKAACRCLLFPLLHAKRWKRETFLHATKEIGDVNPGYLGWLWWVKFSRIKDNIPIIYISSFRHFLVKNKLFIESFHYKVIAYNFLLIFS